jgi:aldehyde:ferredoxin oxidoreductase
MTGRHGYAGRILKVDLSSGAVAEVPTWDYADRFLGGTGIAAKIYWDEVPPGISAFDPDNRLILMTGPLAGFSGLSGSRWLVSGKAPAMDPEQFSYSNLGGRWGAQLKFAGYDGMVVHGRSEKPAYIFVRDGTAEVRDASGLWGKTTIEARDILKQELGSTVAVVACGPAGENLVAYATILADNDASGSSGFGAVMGSKRLKAIVVAGRGRISAADPDRLKELRRYVRQLSNKDLPRATSIGHAAPESEETAEAQAPAGTGPKDIVAMHFEVVSGQKAKLDLCLGCIGHGGRIVVESRDGKARGKSYCGSCLFYINRATRFYGKETEVPFYANRLCDAYGIDALSIMSMIMWLSRCRHAGVLTDESTGIPLSKIGSWEYIEALVKKTSLREGFGDALAQGIGRAAQVVGGEAPDLITDFMSRAGHHLTYCPRMFPAHGLLYAMEPRQAIGQLHEMGVALFQFVNWASGFEGSYLSSEVFRKIAARFWGGELAVDFSTYDGKALAAARIQEREYAKESLILCDFAWPILHTAGGDHVGDPAVESDILSAVTGDDVDEEGLYRIGERVFNLHRAIHIREGHDGRRGDRIPEALYTMPLKGDEMNPECLAPGKNGEVVSRKGAVVDRDAFEKMKDEYYELRGWDVATGLQTTTKLNELSLPDVARDLEQKGLVR